MIRKIELTNFKNFNFLKLEQLKPITLIVGKNNIGKTNLLEAIFIGSNPSNLNLFLPIMNKRAGFVDPSFLEYFFRNSDKQLSIQVNDVKGCFSLLKREGEIVGLKSKVDGKEFCLEFQKTISVPRKIEFSLKTEIIEERIIARQTPEPLSAPIIILLIGASFSLSLPDVLSKLLKKAARQKVMKIFKTVFGQKIDNIFPEAHPPSIYIEIDNKVLPLSFMGEGNIRIFHIWASSLELLYRDQTKPKVILIDEIENGLHYSIKPKLWEVICDISKQMQVIMTTHDEEFFTSLFAFKEVERYKEDIVLVRLDKNRQGEYVAKYYDFDMLKFIAEKRQKALEDIWEIRG